MHCGIPWGLSGFSSYTAEMWVNYYPIATENSGSLLHQSGCAAQDVAERGAENLNLTRVEWCSVVAVAVHDNLSAGIISKAASNASEKF